MAKESDLPHRRWPEIRDRWLGHLPADWQPTAQRPSLEELLRISGVLLKDRETVDIVPNLRESVFSEALFLRCKSTYCFDTAKSLNENGFSTWSAVMMYDCCFFAAKAACYLLGVANLSRDSSYYVDAFATAAIKRKVVDVGHTLLKLPERMTHNSLWTIFHRLVRTLKTDDDFQNRILELRNRGFDTLSRERNRLFYISSTWSREDNLDISDLDFRITYLENVGYINGTPGVTAEYVHEYYSIAIILNNLVDYFLADIGRLAPAVGELLRMRPGPRRLESFAA